MTKKLKNQIANHLSEQKSFTVFRLPNAPDISFLEIDNALEFHFSMLDTPPSKQSFVVYPFDDVETPGWWFNIRSQQTFKSISENASKHDFNLEIKDDRDRYNEYSLQFKEMMTALKSGTIKKVILSREIILDDNLISLIPNIFLSLQKNLPNAFVYLLLTPQTGIWIGASPEILLKHSDGVCTTVSLAGTRDSFSFNPGNWSQKEVEEQGIVSNYIDRILEQFRIAPVDKQGPVIVNAGNVSHLKTSYQFPYSAIVGNLGRLIEQLHPTPALCGEPKQKALNLIRRVEKHKRYYYGGFIGPVADNEMHLFVNIRCMKVSENTSTLYVGGGITSSSDEAKEWKETSSKSQTLLSIISQTKKEAHSGPVNQ